MSVLSNPYFHDEAEAFRFVEGVIWPQGPVCPHCGCMGRISAIKPNAEKRVRMGASKSAATAKSSSPSASARSSRKRSSR